MTPTGTRTGRARLLADAGAAACAPDFFRSAGFLAAEGVTHTLLVETDDGRSALPIIVRDIPGTSLRDGISPYGYPGGTLQGAPPDPREVDLRPTGLVSVFVRDRLRAPALAGGTVRGHVHLHDPSVPRHLNANFRRALRHADRVGYTTDALAGVEVDDATLDGFARCYHETMNHVGAEERYLFGRDYLRACLDVPHSWLAVARAADGTVASGEIAVTSDGILHSYLTATRTELRVDSPAKSAKARLMTLADELGTTLNHGGGSGGLDRHKRSCSNGHADFVTHEIVARPDDYRALAHAPVDGPPADGHAGFFPAYRAPRP